MSDERSTETKREGRRRLPPWLKRRYSPASQHGQVSKLLADLNLATVCQGAQCPNLCECYGRGTATFLILGNRCTRNCRFCAIPDGAIEPPAEDEPQRVAEACARLKLKHVVITSVTRDDLPDGGAGHFARTIHAVRDRLGQATIEVLTPDFQGDTAAIDTVLAARPDVFNHNLETVPRLYATVRPQADYQQSLNVLRTAKDRHHARTKSGLMVGLGETQDEVLEVFRDLRNAGCDILTVGQYLAPTGAHVPVEEFITPERFERYKDLAEEMGFAFVASGPFVRSSYHAEEVFQPPADQSSSRSGQMRSRTRSKSSRL